MAPQRNTEACSSLLEVITCLGQNKTDFQRVLPEAAALLQHILKQLKSPPQLKAQMIQTMSSLLSVGGGWFSAEQFSSYDNVAEGTFALVVGEHGCGD